MKHLTATLTLTVSLLAGCAALPGTPDWVSGPAARYSASQYLIGRGQAASSDEARDRARADLAKTFEVNLSVESEDVQAFRSTEGGSSERGQYQASSTRRVAARSDRVVEGVEIAETWQDPATKDYHALAVLPRLKAATALREDIVRQDDATRAQLDRARNAQDLLLKIAAAAQAVSLQSERAAMQKSLRVADPLGMGAEPAWNLDTLRADLDALLKRVKLEARASSDSDAALEPLVKGGLASAGFLADGDNRSDFALEGSLALDDLGRQDGWYWQRGTLEVRLIETASQRVRGTRRWPLKSSALSHEGAVQRVFSQADAILKKELRATLIGFAAGEAAH